MNELGNLSSFPAFVQAMGVVAIYAILKEFIPRILGKNGSTLTIGQHDKECGMKLTPIRDEIKTIHSDLRFYMRSQGVVPPSDQE